MTSWVEISYCGVLGNVLYEPPFPTRVAVDGIHSKTDLIKKCSKEIRGVREAAAAKSGEFDFFTMTRNKMHLEVHSVEELVQMCPSRKVGLIFRPTGYIGGTLGNIQPSISSNSSMKPRAHLSKNKSIQKVRSEFVRRTL